MGIAAPIFGAHGDVAAALSIVLIRSRVDEEDVTAIIQAVIAAAAEISSHIELLGP